MLTPEDIERKGFSSAVRGYKSKEVDDFLEEIYVEFSSLLEENSRLKQEADESKKALIKYKNSENSVLNTIESAKHLMNDISASAEKRAEIILKNAQMDAESIQKDAKESIIRLTEEGERLKKRVSGFKERYRALLESELDRVDGESDDLFAQLEKDFLPASLTKNEQKTSPEIVKIKEQPIVQRQVTGSATMEINEDISIEEQIFKDMEKGSLDQSKATVVIGDEDLTKTKIL